MSPDRRERVLTALLSMQRQSWEQGVAAQAAWDLGRLELAELLAEAAVTRQAADGRLGVVEDEPGAVNGAACGETVVLLARTAGTGRWALAAERQLGWLDRLAPRAADGTLFHLLHGEQVWADSVHMTVPTLAVAGRIDLAVTQVEGHRRRLHDPASGLYAARWDERIAAVTHPEHWGTASGWVISGIARALHVERRWPGGVRDRFAGHVQGVLDACLAHRRPDGLFCNVLDDPATFRETNAAQMMAYAAATGVADGWLPARYAAVARGLYAEAVAQVDPRGLVTGACGSPHFDTPGLSAEAQAFHLMAGAAVDRLDDVAGRSAAGRDHG